MSSDGAEKQKAVDRYLGLLKAGGSDYPMNLLKNSGVDMSDPETYLAIIRLTDELVSQLESEMAKLE